MTEARGTGRVAVVTGGCRGIGRGIALRLAQDGMTVVAWDLADVVREHGDLEEVPVTGSLRVRAVDVGSAEQIAEGVEQVVAEHGSVDVLVNNAAISPKAEGARVPPHETSPDEWEQVVRVNLTGPFLACRAVIPHMQRRGWGRIVNMSSKAGRSGAMLAGLPYGVTKTGINGLTRTLAPHVAPMGITVNSIAPGRIRTPMAAGVSDEVNARLVAATPVGRFGEPEDIAALVSYLCRDEAGFLTGDTIDINGGAYMAP
ncbi:SDR family NAD(P)-dependent oxidoreductase [Blastococcus sp. TF02A-30]|uniref:SDR family oxidoreductase n=1 Tax=Blastococcus sp. TF02A-30 TaxID=2250580 RepID=UPI000DEA1CD7|nr:SDR family NAD(P)-dependent oxidoreductase [Blastococcus sp. TF02A-30]RBY92984.1 SDR family NAD(P)-dependent oxidoreductase [Blastococcus sp. TF02A-30]